MFAIPPRLSAALQGRYAIERALGEGGMATVYLARDLKHERHVALKVLKPELSAVVGAERFLAEIRTTANLQHPNILPLYDSGEADSFLYFVMPHVEGDTLRDRLDREKQLSVDEAVKIAAAVANALDFAHEHGVVHRDIKPGNILFQAGQPVVGDFGIALAVGAGGGARLTETGLSVGTPYYMSPEQATGDQNVGPRSDVYSLGCVLYEMLTGDPPYTGSTAQAVLGQIIAGRPVTTTERRDSVPQHVDAAVRCALEKVPADRFARARDFAAALANPGFRHGEAGATAGVVALRRWKVATALGGLMAVAALAWAVRPRTTEIAERIVRFTVPYAETSDTASFLAGRVASTRDKVNELSLSPDGSLLAYAAFDGQKWSLFVYDLERAETERWAASDTVGSPFFSPDGEWIGVITPNALKRINVATRQVETLATGTGSSSLRGSAAWGDDGTILVATYDGVYRVPAGGGGFEKIPVPAGTHYASPQFLPGSRTALFAVNHGVDPKKGSVVAIDLKTGDETVLVEEAAAPRYSPTGHLLFLREGTLLGMAFDAKRLAVTGEPVVMAQGVMQAYYMDNSGQETGTGQISLSASGDVAYATGGVTPEAPLLPALFDRSGLVRTLDVGARGYAFFRYSPDGAQLAYHAGPGQNNAIGIITLATGVTRKLSLGGFTVQQPTWSPDDKWLAFESDSSGTAELYRVPTDGTGSAERLLPPGTEGWPYSWSKQGVLAYGSENEIWVLPPDGKPSRFVETPYYAMDASFSPDGEWLAYIAPTGENGPTEVFVRPYPGPGAAVQVSDGGGYNPGWSRGGDTLYFGSDRHLMAVGVTTRGAEFRAGRPAVFISDWPYRRTPLRGYDVAPDGRILQYYSPPQKGVPERIFQQVHLVLGFGGELKRRIPN